MTQMISSRIMRVVALCLLLLAAISIIARCRGRSSPRTPRMADATLNTNAAMSDRAASVDRGAAEILRSRHLPPDSLISRFRSTTNAPAKDDVAVGEPQEDAPSTKKPAGVSAAMQSYVRPDSMISLVASNVALESVSTEGVDLRADSQNVSDFIAQSYINKATMLSREGAYAGEMMITYAPRNRHAGILSGNPYVDQADASAKLPAPPVDSPDVVARALYYMREADAKMKSGKAGDALDLFNQVLAIYPEMSYAHKQIGRIYLLLGDYDRAISSLEQSLSADDNLAETLNELGIALLHAGKGEKALEVFRGAVEANPLYIEAMFNVGLALRTLQRPEEARGQFRAYLEEDVLDARAYRELAVIDMMENKPDDALGNLDTAMKLDPEWYSPALDAAIIHAGRGENNEAVEMLLRTVDTAPLAVLLHFYNEPVMKEVRLIPESKVFEAALVARARKGT